MKKIKIIVLFILIFSFGFSEENTSKISDKARIAQLEHQIETQKRIIERYEKLEDKIDSRISQSLDLDKEVKKVHKDNIQELEDTFRNKMNWILTLISSVVGIVALISIMPIYQSWTSRKIIKKLEEQERELGEQSQKVSKSFEDLEKLRNEIIMIYSEVYGSYIHSELDGFMNESDEYDLKRRFRILIDFSMKRIQSLKEVRAFEKIAEVLDDLILILEMGKTKNLNEDALEVLKMYLVECDYILENLNEIALVGNIIGSDLEKLENLFNLKKAKLN